MIDIFISVHLLRITSRPDILIPPETRINTTKKHRPRSSISAKTVPLVRLQGFEPWTPWLRVRCSTNWAKDAYLIVCLSFFVSFVPQDMLYYTLWFEESQHLFLIFFIFFFFIFYIFIWCNFIQHFFHFRQRISDMGSLAVNAAAYRMEILLQGSEFSFFQNLWPPALRKYLSNITDILLYENILICFLIFAQSI